MSQITLDGKTVEWLMCNFPGCNSRAVDAHKGLLLCAKHLEMAKFIDWYLGGDEVGQKVGTSD